MDLREDAETLKKLAQSGKQPTTMSAGQALKSKTGALAYVECSAKTQKGLKEVFETAIHAHMRPDDFKQKAIDSAVKKQPMTPKRHCILL